jgi:hypothetical protein
MSGSITPRNLSPDEAALLTLIVRALQDDNARILAAQIAATAVSGGIPTMLDLAVAPGAPLATSQDGPLPVRAIAPQGEILVWVRNGTLAALEYASTSDDAPTEMPSPATVHTTP